MYSKPKPKLNLPDMNFVKDLRVKPKPKHQVADIDFSNAEIREVRIGARKGTITKLFPDKEAC